MGCQACPPALGNGYQVGVDSKKLLSVKKAILNHRAVCRRGQSATNHSVFPSR